VNHRVARWLSVAVFLGCGSRTDLLEVTPVSTDGPPAGSQAGASDGVCPITPAYLLAYETPPGSQARAAVWSLDLDTMRLQRAAEAPCRADLPAALAVDHAGRVYLEYQSEGIDLYTVDVPTGQCANSGLGSVSYGAGALAFRASGSPPTETLCFAGYFSSPPGSSFRTQVIATVSPGSGWTNVGMPAGQIAHLAGTGDGKLFAAYELGADAGPAWAIGSVDPASGSVRRVASVPLVAGEGVRGIVMWRGIFVVFTSVAGQPSSSVLRFDPTQGAWTQGAPLDLGVQDVGLSICAPLQ
jgi:hypothetical protein